jgi:hypothetical protein
MIAVRSGSSVTIYVNGSQDPWTGTDSSGALSFGTCALLIGTDADTGCNGALGNYTNGTIDDIRVYNRALTASEIQSLANPATPTPTPTPGPIACSQYTTSSTIPTGYASPYDVVSSPSTNLIQATCSSTGSGQVTLDLGKNDPLQYIYNTGYLFKTGGTQWTPISYTSAEALIANAWYPKSANTTITMTSTELANPSYSLAYICSWTGSQWKCGCRDQACTESYWQIQSFKR